MVAGQQQELFHLKTEELENRVKKLSRSLLSKNVERVFWGALDLLKNHQLEAYKGDLRVILSAVDATSKLLEYHKIPEADPKYAVLGGLHDTGKCIIPLTTLNKSHSQAYGPWTGFDKALMDIHPYVGYCMLMEASEEMGNLEDKSDVTSAALMAVKHHRRQKNPYPDLLPPFPEILDKPGLKEKIELANQIVYISDQYEASYRDNPKHQRPLTHDEARERLIENSLYEEDRTLIQKLFVDDDTGVF